MSFTSEHLAGSPDLIRRAYELGGIVFNGSRSGNELHVLCTFHNDTHPSMDINVNSGLFICRACGASGDPVCFLARARGLAEDEAIAELRQALGLNGGGSARKIVGTKAYDIRDAAGKLVATHERRDYSNGSKDFSWKRDGKYGLGGLPSADIPLYGSHLLAEADSDLSVILTEGEKAADALISREVIAVGTATGASGTPGTHALEVLQGRRVDLWPDFDEAGRQHMARIESALAGVASEVRWLTWGEKPKDDAADFFARGGTVEQLDSLLAESRPHEQRAPRPEPPSVGPRMVRAFDVKEERVE